MLKPKFTVLFFLLIICADATATSSLGNNSPMVMLAQTTSCPFLAQLEADRKTVCTSLQSPFHNFRWLFLWYLKRVGFQNCVSWSRRRSEWWTETLSSGNFRGEFCRILELLKSVLLSFWSCCKNSATISLCLLMFWTHNVPQHTHQTLSTAAASSQRITTGLTLCAMCKMSVLNELLLLLYSFFYYCALSF